MSEEEILCSFCGRAKSQTKLLIAGLDAHICDICISQADMILKDDEASKDASDFAVELKPPKEIKNFLKNSKSYCVEKPISFVIKSIYLLFKL